MSTAKYIKHRPKPEQCPSFAQSPRGRDSSKIDQSRLENGRIRAEAERRASFVRGVGNSVCGYRDGYRDGFEHAIDWLLGEIPDLLSLEYRPDAGMEFSQRYYGVGTKERKKLLELFDQKTTASVKATRPQPVSYPMDETSKAMEGAFLCQPRK